MPKLNRFSGYCSGSCGINKDASYVKPAFRELAELKKKNEDIDNWLSVNWKMIQVPKIGGERYS